MTISTPKSVYEIMDAIPYRDGASIVKREVPMLKAYSKKYKSRNLLVNNTHFSFDEDGYCEIEDKGNNRLDFELLLKKNHVEQVFDEDPSAAAGEPREDDVRAGIDEKLFLDEEEELEEEEPEEDLLDEEEELEEDLDESEEDIDLEF